MNLMDCGDRDGGLYPPCFCWAEKLSRKKINVEEILQYFVYCFMVFNLTSHM